MFFLRVPHVKGALFQGFTRHTTPHQQDPRPRQATPRHTPTTPHHNTEVEWDFHSTKSETELFSHRLTECKECGFLCLSVHLPAVSACCCCTSSRVLVVWLVAMKSNTKTLCRNVLCCVCWICGFHRLLFCVLFFAITLVSCDLQLDILSAFTEVEKDFYVTCNSTY